MQTNSHENIYEVTIFSLQHASSVIKISICFILIYNHYYVSLIMFLAFSSILNNEMMYSHIFQQVKLYDSFAICYIKRIENII